MVPITVTRVLFDWKKRVLLEGVWKKQVPGATPASKGKAKVGALTETDGQL